MPQIASRQADVRTRCRITGPPRKWFAKEKISSACWIWIEEHEVWECMGNYLNTVQK